MTDSRLIRNIKLWGPVGLYMGVLFALSSQPELPPVPGLDELDWSDKIKHFMGYAVLGALLWRALGDGVAKWRRFWLSVGIATLYGLTDEIHQIYVPGRSFDPLDLLADALGAAAGAGHFTYHRYRGTREKG